jgi:hypothetical protein
MTVEQKDNYGREVEAWLPTIEVEGAKDAVVEIFDEHTGQLVYTLPMQGQTFQPGVFGEGPYTVRVGDSRRGHYEKRVGVRARPDTEKTLLFNFG